MCVTSAALVGRTAGDTLFLDRYGADALAYMYLGTASIVGLFSLAFGLLAGRFPLSRLVAGVAVLLSFMALGVRALVGTGMREAGIAAFLMGDLLVFVPVLVFWSFATQLFQPREAKRFFGYIGAAGTAGCIATGFLLPLFAARFETADLFLLAIALLLLFALVGALLGNRDQALVGQAPKRGPEVRRRSFSALLRSPQTRDLAAMVFLATVSLTLIDFQFKSGAKASFEGRELVSFFGTFYGAGNAVALLIQLFLVHRIMRHGGLLMGLRVLPSALLIGSVVTAITGTLAGAVASKFLVQVLAFTIDVAALQVLYMGVARSSRHQTRAVVDGMLKPVAIAVAGVAALLVSGAALIAADRFASVPVLAGGAALSSLGWLVWTGRNHHNYVKALADSLSRGRLDVSGETTLLQERESRLILERTVREASDGQLARVTELVSSLPEINLSGVYMELLHRPSAESRFQACTYLAEYANAGDADQVAAYVEDADPRIRRAAVRVIGRRGDRSVRKLHDAAADPDPFVRAEAAVHSMRRGGEPEIAAMQKVLDGLLLSPDTGDRIAVASVIDEFDEAVALPRWSALLIDPEDDVRRAALRALRRRPVDELLQTAVSLLSDRESGGDAEEALLAFGERALGTLPVGAAEDGSASRQSEGSAHRVWSILSRVPAGRPLLFEALERANEAAMRNGVLRALSRSGGGRLAKGEEAALLRTFDASMNAALEQERLCRALAGEQNATLLLKAAREVRDEHVVCLCYVVGLLIGIPASALIDGLASDDPARRAAALEVMDNAMDRTRRGAVLFLFDADDPGRAADTIRADIAGPSEADSRWHTAGWIEYDRLEHSTRRLGWVVDQLDHPSDMVREIALRAVSELGTEEHRSAMRGLLRDPHSRVRGLAGKLLSEHSEGSEATSSAYAP